jgi:hypothetical protein
MHSLKEELHQIFEESQNLGEGTLKLIDWLDKARIYIQLDLVYPIARSLRHSACSKGFSP